MKKFKDFNPSNNFLNNIPTASNQKNSIYFPIYLGYGDINNPEKWILVTSEDIDYAVKSESTGGWILYLVNERSGYTLPEEHVFNQGMLTDRIIAWEKEYNEEDEDYYEEDDDISVYEIDVQSIVNQFCS